MRYRLLTILTAAAVVAAVVAAGCTKDDTSLDTSLPYEPSESPIGFSSIDEAAVTRGYICDAINPLDTMEINAYYTKQSVWSDETAEVDRFMSQQFISKTGSDWVYSPIKYWPNNAGDKVSFFSISPYNEIKCENDETTGRPRFMYEANPFAEYNDDLMMGTVLDATKSTEGVTFEMEHLLTRINIEVAAINALEVIDGQTYYDDDQPTNEYNVTYAVNGVIFNDVLIAGEVIVDEDTGALSWEVDPSSKFYIAATQGKTLMAYDDATLDTTPAGTDPADYIYNSVCRENEGGDPIHAIFVMPQEVENNPYETEPTVELRIRKSFEYWSDVVDLDLAIGGPNGEGQYLYKGEVIYIPKAIALPTPKTEGWKKGENLTMRFIFDLSAENPTPLTVLSMIYDYNDVDININVNRNVYIYSDKNDTIYLGDNETEATMNFYTNYLGDLTLEEDHHIELDGTTTTSHGFVFFPGVYDAINHNHWFPKETGLTDGDYTQYKVTSNTDSDYFFYYWLKKSTRADEGCYVGADGTGINKYGTDAVYLLRLTVDDDHLDRCDYDGTLNESGEYGTLGGNIGVEMLSNAGGMITKIFPIKVIKKLPTN